MSVYLALAIEPALVHAEDAERFIRVETGMHGAPITQLKVSEKHQLLVTTSTDKTLRLWDLDTGKPRGALRVPIGPGPEGELYGLAVNPVTSGVAVAGYTGLERGDAPLSVESCRSSPVLRNALAYFFDLETGRFVRSAPLENAPAAPTNLQYTPDGRMLAVALPGTHGIRLYDAHAQLVAWDEGYENTAIGLTFGPDGALVTSSADGKVRRYAPPLKGKLLPEHTNDFGASARPTAIRFSPDGKRLAVGFRGAARVALLDPKTLKVIKPELGGSAQARSLHRIAWSQDSRTLYAYGMDGDAPAAENALRPIFFWRDASPAGAGVLRVSARYTTALESIVGGGFAFATEDPGIGRTNPDHGVRYFDPVPLTSFAGGRDAFRVSKSGSTLEIPIRVPRAGVLRFSFEDALAPATAARALELRAGPDSSLSSPRTVGGLRETTDTQSRSITYRGKSLEQGDDAPRSWAADAGSSGFLLGTRWWLVHFNGDGSCDWAVQTGASVDAVNSSGDGRWAIAALSDGTIHWYQMKRRGREALALYPHVEANALEWALWTPDGFYAASSKGTDYLGVQTQQGSSLAPTFQRLGEFQADLARTDRIRQALQSAD